MDWLVGGGRVWGGSIGIEGRIIIAKNEKKTTTKSSVVALWLSAQSVSHLGNGWLLMTPLKPVNQPLPSPEPVPVALPSTQVSETHWRRWSSHDMSAHPAGANNSTAARPCFWTLITDPPPPPTSPLPFLHRTSHTSRGAAAERAGLVLCAGELAPSAGAQRHHHRLQAPVQRQPQPAWGLVGETLSGWWVWRQRPPSRQGMTFQSEWRVILFFVLCLFLRERHQFRSAGSGQWHSLLL